MAVPCWAERREADPRFAYDEDTFAPPPGTWAPDCGHPACLQDDQRCEGLHGWDCPVSECRWDTTHAICDLDEGHDGEHVFTSPNEVTLIFPDAATPPADPDLVDALIGLLIEFHEDLGAWIDDKPETLAVVRKAEAALVKAGLSLYELDERIGHLVTDCPTPPAAPGSEADATGASLQDGGRL